VLKIHWRPASSLPTLELWRLSICGSFYQKGAPIAYVRPLPIQGRRWLWNHVKYPYAGSNAIVDAEQLLELIQRIDADELTTNWQS
jgi:hypothetical protein